MSDYKDKFVSDKMLRHQDLITGMLNFNDKLILTGSSVLYLLNLLDRKPTDIDFALTESLSENELDHFKSFFDLRISGEGEEYEVPDEKGNTELHKKVFDSKESISKPIIQFHKRIYFNQTDFENVKIDIFNKEHYPKKDIFFFNYTTPEGNFDLKFLHPSVALSAKTRYAFDPRIKDSFKHMQDIKNIINEQKLIRYFDCIKHLKNQLQLEHEAILKESENSQAVW